MQFYNVLVGLPDLQSQKLGERLPQTNTTTATYIHDAHMGHLVSYLAFLGFSFFIYKEENNRVIVRIKLMSK